ncbi:MAG TPA: ribonuclease III [Acidimicrobiia bacterium]|nr:ribonuclease III [Acidimicrobiia bacterium]
MAEGRHPLEATLGYQFGDASLLDRALTHRSYTAEGDADESNERLEFLGDAVLGLIVSTELHEAWNLKEGEMAKVRAAVVNESTLAGVARSLGIDDAVRISRGEEASGGRSKPSILADTMEALIGAVYLDGGMEAARRVVLGRWRPIVAERAASPGQRDYKTRLQEVLARAGDLPVYDVSGSGPDHARSFEAVVLVGDEVLGRGTGSSKKRAQQAAARDALEARGIADA